MSGSTDTVGYNPVTGEMETIIYDDEGNPMYSSMADVDAESWEAYGHEGDAGSRGGEEGPGWAAGGGEDTDVGRNLSVMVGR